jgi:parallel beta-helix repeat protein
VLWADTSFGPPDFRVKGGLFVRGFSSLIQNVQVSTNAFGIVAEIAATIENCTAFDNRYSGFKISGDSVLRGCTAIFNWNNGFELDSSTAIACSSSANEQAGFRLGGLCVVSTCASTGNTGDGFYLTGDDSLLERCMARSNGSGGDGAGIHLTSFASGNRIDGNQVCENDRGIQVEGDGNFIVRNSASGNSTNFLITGTQTIGPIITATGTIATDSPWANFENTSGGQSRTRNRHPPDMGFQPSWSKSGVCRVHKAAEPEDEYGKKVNASCPA